MKILILACLLSILTASSAFAGWTANKIGGTTFWNNSNGGTITCNTIGQTTFCN